MSVPAKKQPSLPPQPQPLIPDRYFDVPSQRLFYLSLGALIQAIKLFDFIWPLNWTDNRLQLCRKWVVVDFLYFFVLALLRIPRLTYSKATTALFIITLWLLNGIMFGGISLNVGSPVKSSKVSQTALIHSTSDSSSFLDILAPFSLGLIKSSHARDQHLLGQHTIRMSPISTAHLNPDSENFCFSSTPGYVLLPVLLNNTNIGGLKYSISPLDTPSQRAFVDVSAKHLEQNHQERMQVVSVPSHSSHNEEDEYDDDDDDDDADTRRPNASLLQKTQSLVYIRISKPGTVRLERVYDTSQSEARLVPSEVVIVPCPSVAFVDATEPTDSDAVRCSGQDNILDLMIDVYGVPPLSLRWLKTINSTREQFLVEGIESEHDREPAIPKESTIDNSRAIIEKRFIPKDIKIPLAISLNEPGTHLYALEEIVDGLGNVVRAGPDPAVMDNGTISKTKTTRSFVVLKKALVSFSNCNLQHPKPLLIGSEANLTIITNDADDFDAPWEVTLRYNPPSESEDSKVHKPWKKVLKTQGESREITVRANTPGQYSIVGIKGKHCTGEVLSPDTCSVVEKPLPSAEIEWKRIHECSGDTGVSASLILRGTPPFVVGYKTQRNNEPPKEKLKKFMSSRGELTLQPEQSGHYTFTFVSMSDANYQKVELEGPSIDQVVHPLAAAEFADTGEKTRTVSNCAGETVDVDVDLRGTGPWNLELQVIGPRSSEKILIDGIKTSRKRIQVPIPKGLQKDGGTFEIDLVSVEDVYKCKRPISVPGIVVNVKRTWPTAQFYGKPEARHVIITEGERANMPLRLTGDGPWRIKYQLQGPEEKVFTAVVHSPNDFLKVQGKGIYEIIEVKDSLCPGTVVTDAATYEVDYIPRPSAKLSSSTMAQYDPYNGSYVLPPICEGISDHVDLDLTGKPPFQITYNIAQDSETGGTKVIGQPTFHSIQPRTRFQLQTTTPGRMYYEVKQIGDAAYPLNKNNVVIPKSERLLFEQQVSQRPSVRFKNRNRMTYCLNDPLVPSNTISADGILVFQGTPPFTLTLSVKDLAASDTETHIVQVNDHVWRLSLPSYTFKSIGAHLVSIDSVADASNCAQAALDPLFSSVWVDVAETAAIIPFERREDVCVGDVVQFQLEGIPPWTVGYRVNGKQHSQEVKTSPFSLPQSQPGELVITSIAHQHKMCKAVVTDLRYTVHPLPSAQVGHGKRIYQDIHEGDQAEILFTLLGEPPFTFTYQRAEPSSKKGGKGGKVLETHTVSRVMTHEYSMFSALEGTWTVTSISDRYCRYPPVHPEGDLPRS